LSDYEKKLCIERARRSNKRNLPKMLGLFSSVRTESREKWRHSSTEWQATVDGEG